MQAKIFYNILETDFKFQTSTHIFYFSSLYYENKFRERYIRNREELKYKLSSRYNIDFNIIEYFDVILYSNIEKRGFYILSLGDREVCRCLKNLRLDGVIKMLKN